MDCSVVFKKELLSDPPKSKSKIIEMSTSQNTRRHPGGYSAFSAKEQNVVSSPAAIEKENSEFNEVIGEEADIAVDGVLQIKREPSSALNRLQHEEASAVPELSHSSLHDSTGTEGWKCAICSKNLSSKHHLERHAHQVHGIRQFYQCDMCPKTYAHARSLQDHKRFHTGEKPYACHLCPAAFVRRSALRLHAQAIHDVAGHQACEVCGKKFAFKSTLERHLKVHTGETPHACHLCPRRFARTDRLLAHLRAHAGENPHSCSQCYLRFRKDTTLASHMCRAQSQKLERSEEPEPKFEETLSSEEPLPSEGPVHSEEPAVAMYAKEAQFYEGSRDGCHSEDIKE